MKQLIIFNMALIIVIAIFLFIIKKSRLSDKQKRVILIVASILTVLCHYSSLPYHYIKGGFSEAYQFLLSNPNLVFPIYPCNLVMDMCVIFPFIKNKEGKTYHFFIDYIYCFGIISCLVGTFANVDFIRNPNFMDYDVTKGIVAHAFMLFNVLLLPILGFYKLDLIKNMKNIVASIVLMLITGAYCNLLVSVFGSIDYAYQVNSMFLLHSPFDGVEFMCYPFISCVALVVYFIVFAIAEAIKYPKEERWYNRIKKAN